MSLGRVGMNDPQLSAQLAWRLAIVVALRSPWYRVLARSTPCASAAAIIAGSTRRGAPCRHLEVVKLDLYLINSLLSSEAVDVGRTKDSKTSRPGRGEVNIDVEVVKDATGGKRCCFTLELSYTTISVDGIEYSLGWG